jgi:nucleoside-diphosphate-sugar epimerase
MRALLIGGTGFIGSFLTPELQRLGAEVAVLTRGRTDGGGRKDLTRLIGDRKHLRASEGAIRDFAPDVVIDLVLSSGTQARELMGVVRGIAGRVVALSSMDVYRACGVLHGLEEGPLEPVPLTEESALRTKLATYPPAQIQMLQQVFGWLDEEYDKIPVERAILGDPDLPATILRLPMVYGPGDPLHRFFPLVRRMDDGRRGILMSTAAAAWRSPRGFVGNVAAAIALAATSDRAAGRVYNVAEQPSYSELEWATRVGESIGWKGAFVILPPEAMPSHLRMPGNFDQHWSVDSSRIRRQLGYTEPVDLETAIARTVEWERANPPARPITPIDYPAEDAAIAATLSSRAALSF